MNFYVKTDAKIGNTGTWYESYLFLSELLKINVYR